jgi:hypothetical protein
MCVLHRYANEAPSKTRMYFFFYRIKFGLINCINKQRHRNLNTKNAQTQAAQLKRNSFKLKCVFHTDSNEEATLKAY